MTAPTNHRLSADATSPVPQIAGDGLPDNSPAPDAHAEGAGAFFEGGGG
jgi:hypothetical protein